MIGVWRNPGSLLWRIFISVFVACFELASFWQAGNDVTKAVDVTKSLFFNCIAMLTLYEFTTAMEF